MSKIRSGIIKDFRAGVEELKDYSLAEGIYEEIQEAEDISDADKRKLHALLSTKVNQLKQEDHDAKFAAGDVEGAKAVIAPPVVKDKDGNIVTPQKLRTPDEIMQSNKIKREKPVTVPEGCEVLEVTAKELKALQAADLELPAKECRLVGVRPVRPESMDLPITKYKAILKKAVVAAVLAFVALFGLQSDGIAALASDDVAVMAAFNQTDGWKVDVNGDLVPITTNNNALGTTSLYPSQICLNAECKASWGSVVSPMTDYTGYTAPTDAGSNLKLHDDGDLTLGGAVATDVLITWDGNAQDFYIGLDDSDDKLKIGYGSVMDTTEMITIAGSKTLTIADGAEADFQIVLDGYAQDYHIGIDDSGGAEEDLLCIGRDGAVGTNDDLCIGKAGGAVYVNSIDTAGAADIDVGSADVTDVTVVTDGGTLILDGTITLTDSEVISNATDDTVRVASNDAATILEVYTPGTSNEDVSVRLTADAGADAADIMQITHDGATNSLFFESDTASKGTVATILTLAKTGVLTTTSYIDSKITDTTANAVVDVLKLTHDGGTAATGVGTGLVFQVDDAGGIEEQGSIDVALTTVTDGAEDADMIFNINTAGTMAEVVRFVAASSATAGDSVTITQNTTETDAILDILSLANVTGTATHNAGLGITWDFEDAGGAEEQASLDVQLTTATDASEDVAFIFSGQSAGAVAEMFRIQGASSATTGDVVTITQNTTELNAVLDALVLTNAVTGTAAAGAGIGISFQPEDAGGAEEQGSIDVVLTTATDAAEDADIVFNQNTSGTVQETLRLVAEQSATAASELQYASITQETNGTVTVLDYSLNTTGTPAANLGMRTNYSIDDAGGIETQAQMDVILTDHTDSSENVTVQWTINSAGTLGTALQLVGANTATTSDYLKVIGNTTETNGLHNVLVLASATGTATDNYGISISFQPEDATSAEEHARIDILQTTAARATNDTDFVFTQDVNGTLTERVRFDADGGNIVLESGATPLSFGGATSDAYYTNIAVGDAASSTKTVTLPSVTGAFSLETTATTAITADTTATITVVPGTDTLYTYTIDTDNEDCTLTFSAGGTANDRATIIFITDTGGSGDEVMTFDGTLSDSAGTLTLANGTAKRYVIEFISDGTIWNEVSRTAVLG